MVEVVVAQPRCPCLAGGLVLGLSLHETSAGILGRMLEPLDPPGHVQIGLAVKSQDLASPGAALFLQAARSVAARRD